MKVVGDKRKNTRRLLSWAWIYFLHFTGLLGWVQRKIASSRGVIVLTLHRVLEDLDFKNTDSPASLVVRRQTFEQFLAFLRKNYEILALFGESPDWQRRSSRPFLAVTFDDGWKDTAEIAHPLAKKYDIPITVFICPGLMDKATPFWPERVSRAWRAAARSRAESLKFSSICSASLSGRAFSPFEDTGNSLDRLIASLKDIPPAKRNTLVQQLSTLARENCVSSEGDRLERTMTWEESWAIERTSGQIGSHTQHHEILTRLSPDQVLREISDAKLAIESNLDHDCRMFAYPNGSWSADVRNLVVQQGHGQAFINTPGIWEKETDPWLIPRVNIWEGSLTGPSGSFSQIVFQYTAFWRAYRTGSKKRDQESKVPPPSF